MRLDEWTDRDCAIVLCVHCCYSKSQLIDSPPTDGNEQLADPSESNDVTEAFPIQVSDQHQSAANFSGSNHLLDHGNNRGHYLFDGAFNVDKCCHLSVHSESAL